MSQDLIDQFLTILYFHLKFVDSEQAFPMEMDLEQMGLDSMGAISLLLDLEENFGIQFPDDLLTAETFRTGLNLQKAVLSLTNH